MKPWKENRYRMSGATLVEMMFSLTISVIVLGVLTYSSVSISRSLSATQRFMVGVANENRLMDYVAADLRRALGVSIISGGTTTSLRDSGSSSYSITNTTILAINIPDYYASNTPNNAAGSSYKTTRYSRATLNTSSTYNSNSNTILNGTVPWSEAQKIVNGKKVTRFAPTTTSTGEIQVRYYRGVRSNTDSTPCFFRSEYAVGSTTPISTVEIAERISDALSTTTLLVSARNNGQVFRLQSSFTPTYRSRGATSAPTNGVLEVSVRNLRRD